MDPLQLVKEAQSAYKVEDYLKAAGSFQAAQESYHLSGDFLNAAEMANNRSVALLQAGNAQGALEAVKDTIEVFEAAGDLHRQAMALGNRAAAFEALKQFEPAIRDYQAAAHLFRQIGENELYTSTMQALSAVQLRSGRQLEALATMKAGMDKIEHPGLKNRLLKKILDIPFRLLNR